MSNGAGRRRFMIFSGIGEAERESGWMGGWVDGWMGEEIQNSKFRIQNSKFKIQNSKFKKFERIYGVG
jgi:hypothetical protein